MSKKASLEIDGKSFDLPIIHGTEKEQAINISSLRAISGGLITIDPGFKNTGSWLCLGFQPWLRLSVRFFLCLCPIFCHLPTSVW